MDTIRNPLLLSVPLGRWFGLRMRLSALAILVFIAVAIRFPVDEPSGRAAPTAAGTATPTAQPAAIEVDNEFDPVAEPGDAVAATDSTPQLRASRRPAASSASSASGNALLGVTLAVLLLLSVLLHELAEAYVTQRQGGQVAVVVVWPAGGCVVGSGPPAFLGEMMAAAVGPALHLAVCILLVPVVMFNGDLSAFNPFALPAIAADTGRLGTLGLLLFSINWKLLWLSLLPVPPLDGGRMIQAYRAETRGRRRSTAIKWSLLGVMAGLVLLAMFGPMFGNVWTTLLGGCLLVVNTVELVQLTSPEPEEDAPFGYDFSQGYTSLEDSYDDEAEPSERSVSPWQKWKSQREQRRLDRELAERAAAESELDRLLEKISQVGGVDKLSSDEQRTLKRLSARFKT